MVRKLWKLKGEKEIFYNWENYVIFYALPVGVFTEWESSKFSTKWAVDSTFNERAMQSIEEEYIFLVKWVAYATMRLKP